MEARVVDRVALIRSSLSGRKASLSSWSRKTLESNKTVTALAFLDTFPSVSIRRPSDQPLAQRSVVVGFPPLHYSMAA